MLIWTISKFRKITKHVGNDLQMSWSVITKFEANQSSNNEDMDFQRINQFQVEEFLFARIIDALRELP